MNDKEKYILTGSREKEINTLLQRYITLCDADKYFDVLYYSDVTEETKNGYKGKTVYIVFSDTFDYNSVFTLLTSVAFSVVVVSGEQLNSIISLEATKKDTPNIATLKKALNGGNCYFAEWVNQNDKGIFKIKHAVLQSTVSSEYHLKCSDIKGEKRTLYAYNNGIYKEINKEPLRELIAEYLPNSVLSDYNIEQVYKLAKTRAKQFDINQCDSDENIINVKNGLLDIRSMQLKPHTPKYLSTTQLLVNYKAAPNTCKLWNDYINTVCTTENGKIDKEKMCLIQEFFGVALSNINGSKLKKFFLLYSPIGNTGKTVFLNVLASFFEPEKIASIPLQALSERFKTEGLINKRLNIIDDQNTSNIKDISILKSLTGGGNIPVEFKGGANTYFNYTGLNIAACNGLPMPEDDKGDHVFERYCIIAFDNVIPKEKRVIGLDEKIIENEKEGVFLWALEGLHRFIKNGYKFTRCRRSEDITEELRLKADTVYNFIKERCTITGYNKDRVKCTELFSAYEKYCIEEDRNKVGKQNFKSRLLKIGGIGVINSNGERCYTGMVLYTTDRNIKNNDIPF